MDEPRPNARTAARAKRQRRRAFELQQFATPYPNTVHKRRPLRPERLHPYSQGFYRHLLEHRPQWLANAFNVLGYEHELFDLDVEIRHPRQGKPIGRLRLPAAGIFLWMNGGTELSISHDAWHTHMGMGSEKRNPPADYRDAVDIVDEIMNERIVFVSGYRSGKLISAGSVAADHLEDWIERVRGDRDSEELVIRSWHGVRDRRVDLRN